MKKAIFVLAVISLIIGSSVSSCTSSAEKVEDAQDNVDDANEALEEANEDYLNDVEEYKIEIAGKIVENEARIAELKILVSAEKGEIKAIHEKQIIDLEKKNEELRIKMDSYRGDNKEDWDDFKREFNHDMNELGKALKDLGKTNTK